MQIYIEEAMILRHIILVKRIKINLKKIVKIVIFVRYETYSFS